MNTSKQALKASLSRGAKLFIAVLVAATVAPQIINVKPAAATGNGGYPWIDATQLNSANSDYGYYPTCPASDQGCFSGGSNLLYTDSNGHQWGEADPYVEALRNCTSYAAWKVATSNAST